MATRRQGFGIHAMGFATSSSSNRSNVRRQAGFGFGRTTPPGFPFSRAARPGEKRSLSGSPSYVDQGTITAKFSPKLLEQGPVHSKEENLGCVPWTVSVRSQQKQDGEKKTTLVNVSVQCFRKANIEPDFSCKADISVRLVMKRPDEPDLLTNTKDFIFDAKHREVVFAPFTNIDFLNDNRAAFARKGGFFDLEVKLKIRQVNFDLYPILDFTSGGDVVLNVDGRKFYVDKKYLAVHSPYFEALFHGEFAEQNKDEVTLSKVNPEHFMQFLQVIYPPSKKVTADNVMGLVELADQFNAKGVLAKCQEFLCSKESDKAFSLCDKLKVADQRDLKQVKTYVMKRIRTQSEFNRISKKSAGMSQSTLEMLLRKSAALSRSHGPLQDSDEEAALRKSGHLSDESSW